MGYADRKSCPSWARGLKFRHGRHHVLPARSCPSWARGLKSLSGSDTPAGIVVPLVGTWIEIASVPNSRITRASCPSWARGLKCRLEESCRRVCGSCPSWARGLKFIHWNIPDAGNVVPLVGTWIEILKIRVQVTLTESCPSWARGLK